MYYERIIDQYLREWASRSTHKPVLLRGARQVGKSTKNQGTVPRHHDEWSGLLINIICRHNVHMWIVCQHEFLSQRFDKPIDVSL